MKPIGKERTNRIAKKKKLKVYHHHHNITYILHKLCVMHDERCGDVYARERERESENGGRCVHIESYI